VNFQPKISQKDEKNDEILRKKSVHTKAKQTEVE